MTSQTRYNASLLGAPDLPEEKRKAAEDNSADFPIVRDNLGERVGITGKGAGLMRKKFVGLGIIVETVPFVPNKAAARFRWLLTETPDIRSPRQ